MVTSQLGNVTSGCKVQIIDDNDKWNTIAECADTPNAIAQVLRKNGLTWAWVRDFTGERRVVKIS